MVFWPNEAIWLNEAIWPNEAIWLNEAIWPNEAIWLNEANVDGSMAPVAVGQRPLGTT